MVAPNAITKLPPFYEQSSFVNLGIDTPKGTPYKLKYEETAGIYRVHKALPLGFAFPFNRDFTTMVGSTNTFLTVGTYALDPQSLQPRTEMDLRAGINSVRWNSFAFLRRRP